MSGIRGPLTLIRPMNGIMAGVAVWIGWSVETGDPSPLNVPLLMLMASAFLVLSGGNIINDIRDAELDERIHPRRPIPSGIISKGKANILWIMAWVLAAVTTTISLLMNGTTLLPIYILTASLLILAAYEWKLKDRGFPGNLSVSLLTGSTFIFGASLTGSISPLVWAFSALALLINLSRELLKDMEDSEGDSGYRRSLPLTRGRDAALLVSRGAVLIAVAVSILIGALAAVNPMFIVLVIIADGFFVSSVFPSSGISASTMQRRSKMGMMFALLAFYSFALI